MADREAQEQCKEKRGKEMADKLFQGSLFCQGYTVKGVHHKRNCLIYMNRFSAIQEAGQSISHNARVELLGSEGVEGHLVSQSSGRPWSKE
jgi:hypothetical protein